LDIITNHPMMAAFHHRQNYFNTGNNSYISSIVMKSAKNSLQREEFIPVYESFYGF